jgi:hypothetical protein
VAAFECGIIGITVNEKFYCAGGSQPISFLRGFR